MARMNSEENRAENLAIFMKHMIFIRGLQFCWSAVVQFGHALWSQSVAYKRVLGWALDFVIYMLSFQTSLSFYFNFYCVNYA